METKTYDKNVKDRDCIVCHNSASVVLPYGAIGGTDAYCTKHALHYLHNRQGWLETATDTQKKQSLHPARPHESADITDMIHTLLSKA